MPGLLSKQRIVAPAEFNRWRVPLASVAIHLCIGSVYAWSIFNAPLTRLQGVVASAADDWTLTQAARTFVVAIVALGLSAAVAGKWLERVGPRLVGTVAAVCWGGGFFLGAAGIWLHELWLLYLAYGVVGGCGLGLGYVSPVSTLIRWFPDRRGMAAGMAIMGFGGGAILGVPIQERLIEHYYQAPEYLGPADAVSLSTVEGKRFATVAGQLREVVVIGPNDKASMLVPGPEGVYVVGTGRTGAAETFCTLGLAYFVVMLLAAFSYRIPAPGWQPRGWTPPTGQPASGRLAAQHYVDPDEALRTPQFYLLWIVLCLNVTAGIGVLSVAKTMMVELFGATLPAIVDNSFARTYVLMTSVFNMAGRFAWASVSDYLGRQPTYTIFFVLGSLLYVSIPYTAYRMSVEPATFWLVAFYAASMLIFTMYGGGFATIPAYLADLFGARFVGAIHGRLLTAWSVAGVLGPEAITALRERSLARAIRDLAATIDPAAFAARFGAPVAQLEELAANKTVTLANLMELAPSGTPNPTSTLYDTTMHLMAALLLVALAANLLVRPVAPKHYAREEPLR